MLKDSAKCFDLMGEIFLSEHLTGQRQQPYNRLSAS